MHTRPYFFARLVLGVGASIALFGCQGTNPSKPLEPASPSAPSVAASSLLLQAMPVGSGMCHVVVCPGVDNMGNHDALVVDCGSSNRGPHDWDAATVARHIAPLIAGRYVTVVLSHGDKDHSNYIPQIFPNGAHVSAVYYGDALGSYGADAQNWIRGIQHSGRPVHGGAGIAVGNGPVCGAAGTTILAVNTVPGNKNASSLVLGIAYNGHKIILPGDATGPTEASIIRTFGPSLANVALLEASHHGSDSHGSNGQAWAQATTPSHLLVSAGPIGHYGHPRCDVIARYEPYLAIVPDHNVTCATSKTSHHVVRTNRSVLNTEEAGLISFEVPATPFKPIKVVKTGTP